MENFVKAVTTEMLALAIPTIDAARPIASAISTLR
jgi:hypothetical protein